MSSSTTANTTLPRRKIGSRACDACKVRKVRCSEVPPCTRCASIGIACTFNKRQATRGPRSLRAKTLAEIRSIQETQQRQQRQEQQATSFSVGEASPPDSSEGLGLGGGEPRPSSGPENHTEAAAARQTPVSSLIVRLCIFRLRLFPVWPILDAEAVIASLLRAPADLATYALANAVCAAIIAQLKLPFEGRTDDGDPATAASMAAEGQRAKAALLAGGDVHDGHDDGDDDKTGKNNLNMLRISFFQHIYHENMSPGGSKSLLFLREAITIAQIMGLHRRAPYAALPPEESQVRRRIIWLLFVTERGVAMLHKLPTILVWRPNQFPALDDSWVHVGSHNNNSSAEKQQDEAHILPAFKKLVNLFWVFDQGGAFDIILDAEDDDEDDGGGGEEEEESAHGQQRRRSSSRLEYLQRRLQEMSEGSWAEARESNEVQQADILVTKSWMQAVLWRASVRRLQHHHYRPQRSSQPSSCSRNNNKETAPVTATVVGIAAPSHYQQTTCTLAAGSPYRIVNDFLSHISHYSKTALEAHGPTIELKIFEIASALTDALASNVGLLRAGGNNSSNNHNGSGGIGGRIRPVDMLVQLQRLLASSRGGNKPLLTMLCARIAEVESGGASASSPPGRGLRATNNDDDEEGGGDVDAIVFGGYERRVSPSASSSYLDVVRLETQGYAPPPSQLPPHMHVWPGTVMRPEPNHHHQQQGNPNHLFNVEPGGHGNGNGNLGIAFAAQMSNEATWNGWALDLAGMSQISML